MADLLFDHLGFGQTSKSVFSFNSTKQLNPNQSNRRSAVFSAKINVCAITDFLSNIKKIAFLTFDANTHTLVTAVLS